MKIRVIGGTVENHSQSLCQTCRNGMITKGPAESSERVRCECLAADPVMPQPIVSCTSYDDKSRPSLHDMRSIAWILRTDQSGKAIGFVTNKDWKLRFKKEAGEED